MWVLTAFAASSCFLPAGVVCATEGCVEQARRSRWCDVCMPAQGIRPSTLRAAGLGLFATRDHAKDDVVAIYTGREVAASDTTDSAYRLGLSRDIVIDASDPLHTERGRFANHRESPNAALHTLTKRQRHQFNLRERLVVCCWFDHLSPAADARLGVVALRAIKAGREVFVDYGPGYFKDGYERTLFVVLEALGKMLTANGQLLFSDEEMASPTLRQVVLHRLRSKYKSSRPVIDYMYFGQAMKNALRAAHHSAE